MAQEQDSQSQISFLLSDFNTRLRDLEEKNKIIRERVILLGQNLISSREEVEKELTTLKKQTSETKKDLDRMKQLLESLVSETDKYARKEDLVLVEKMLKDFQPLKFARVEDVEQMIDERISNKKIINRENKEI